MHHIHIISHLVSNAGFFSDKISFGCKKIEKMRQPAGTKQGLTAHTGQTGFDSDAGQLYFFPGTEIYRDLPVFQTEKVF